MEDVSLEGLLRQYITNTINGMFTAMPCKIVNVTMLDQQRLDVKPLIERVTPDNDILEHPVILNVPLIFPGSRSSQFSFPVRVGDTVLCIFSQRSLDRFKLGAVESHRPIDFRKYSRNDAMAIPGLFPFDIAVNNPSKHSLSHDINDTVMVHNIGTEAECEVRLKSSGDIVINAPGNKVEVNCQTSVINAEDSATVNTTTSTVNASDSSTVNTSTASINASSSTTIDSPNTTVTGNMLVQGTFTYTSGMVGSGSAGGSTATISGSIQVSDDVTASGISLVNHTHTGDSGGNTSPPK